MLNIMLFISDFISSKIRFIQRKKIQVNKLRLQKHKFISILDSN